MNLARDYPQYKIGKHSYGELEVRAFTPEAQLVIGDYCSFSQGVRILLGGEHNLHWVSTFPWQQIFPNAKIRDGDVAPKSDNVFIGNDVWVGTDVLIMAGVTVGDGAVIGAGAVVTKDVLPYMVVGGVPAKVIKSRFGMDEIEFLLELKWWNWDRDKIERLLPFMTSSDVSGFIERAKEYDEEV